MASMASLALDTRFHRPDKTNNPGDAKLFSVVYKIFKFLDDRDKTQITRIIGADISDMADEGASAGLAEKLSQIYQIVRPVVIFRKISVDEDRQEFITGKLQDYLGLGDRVLPGDSARTRFLDIGGGNGNILSGLQTRLGGRVEDYICLENRGGWQEDYKYSNGNIRYLFWDNQDFAGITDGSVDIVFCMVSLHHMTDDTINSAISEIRRVLRPGGRLLIKEHNATTENLRYILWEHHLYHLLDVAMSNGVGPGVGDGVSVEPVPDWTDYCAGSVNNFKSAEQWQNLITGAGFVFVARTNRFLDGPFMEDTRNPSALYWDEYRG